MATENEFIPHSCTEKMKFIISDCLSNNSSSFDKHPHNFFDNSHFLLTYLPSRQQANLHLFNHTFTNLLHTHPILSIDPTPTFTHLYHLNQLILIYIANDQIISNKFSIIEQDVAGVSESRLRVKFDEVGDGFKYLSGAISMSERDYVIVGYTHKDQFYLILASSNQGKIAMKYVKINDLDNPSGGFLSWFSRKQPIHHYEQIKVFPIDKQSFNSFRVLCIRDNTASTLHITFDEQSTATRKIVYSCHSLAQKIKSNDALLSAIEIGSSKILLAYQVRQKLSLFIMNINNNQMVLRVDHFPTNIPTHQLRILKCSTHLYLTFKDNNHYTCLRASLDKLNELTKHYLQIEPVLKKNHMIWLTGNDKDLYLISQYNIYQLEQHRSDDQSEEKVKLQSFEKWMERTFDAKIRRSVQLGQYFQLEAIYQGKEEKLFEELQHLRKGSGQLNGQVHSRLKGKIICTAIIKTIVSKSSFPQLRQNLTLPTIANELRSSQMEDLLENTLIQQTPLLIKHLLFAIQRTDMTPYLNEILEQTTNHPYLKDCKAIINQIFSEVCERAIHECISTRNENLYELKLLLEITFKFIKVRESHLVNDLLELGKDEMNHEFISNLVLNYKLIRLFMHLFIYSAIPFVPNSVEEMASFLEIEPRQRYLNEFFFCIKQAYDGSLGQEKKVLMKKCSILIKGLSTFSLEIQNIVQRTFPGLLAYIYLNNKNKKHFQHQIQSIADKCTSPNAAYTLLLSSAGQGKTENQTLEKIRFCRQLQLPYKRNGDLWGAIKANKHEVKTISKRSWERSKQILQPSNEEAEEITKFLTIIG